ncbi:MAG: nicotinate-nucleotide adenylyltransferase [Candidatus Obscuribacterales bacterium]|nr:nicotinate-nucleotide adenylyltransferase [Candidatus Obscuribacterales bacterium]
MQDIGLFCGTFNPIHVGHLLIAECARDQFGLAKVIFVTSPCPPHRSDTLLGEQERHTLVEAAIKTNANFEASPIELNRQGPSYTIDTVNEIDALYQGKARINLIIGGDNLHQLADWHKAEELLSKCRILIVPRLRYIHEKNEPLTRVGIEPVTISEEFPQSDIETVDFPGIAISGSKIRKRICQGKTVLYMVPPAVNELIIKNGYFKEPISPGSQDTCAGIGES